MIGGISGISSVYNRINEINRRINEIRSIGLQKVRAVRSLTPYNEKNNISTDNKDKFEGKTFKEILNEVMKSEKQTLLPNNKGKTLNMKIGDKNDVRNIVVNNYKTYGNNKNSREYIDKVIKDAANQFGVDPDLIFSVIKKESEFNPSAISSKGAMGLMQLMPDTASALGVNNPFDIKENIYGGTRYLKSLLSKYDGDVKKALAAYNAGPVKVDNYNGIPPYRETVNYVDSILKDYNHK